MKKIYFIITLLILLVCSFFSVKGVNAETLTYTNLFETTLEGNSGPLVTATSSVGTPVISSDNYYMNNASMYLDGNSYMQYDLDNLTTFDISFMFYKSNTDSYPRLLYLIGPNREIEVKGSSNDMYINGAVSAGWKQNEWNSVRITRDSNYTIAYYVNDKAVYYEFNTSPLKGVRFGQGSSTSNKFNGYIDNLQISNELDCINFDCPIAPGVYDSGIESFIGDPQEWIDYLSDYANLDTSVYDSYFLHVSYFLSSKKFDYKVAFYNSSHKLSGNIGISEYNLVFSDNTYPFYVFSGNFDYTGQPLLVSSIGSNSSFLNYSTNPNNVNSWGGGNRLNYYYSNRDIYNLSTGELFVTANANTAMPYDGMSYIDIPITDLYDNEIGKWIPYQKYFKTTNEDNSYNFYVTYIDDSTSVLPSLPLELFVTNDVLDIESHINNIANSVHSSADGYGGGFSVGGGTFGGGGGGGRFTDEDNCLLTDNYTFYNNTLSSDKHYGFLSLTPNSCVDISSTTPSDYKTQYIRIYYDVSFYESVDDVVDDYIENVNKDLGDYTESIKHYNNPIKEILSYISTFYNGLPTELKYLIISTLIISIYLVIIRFIL